MSRLTVRIMFTAAVIAMIAASAGASPREQVLKAHLRFQATSTLIRTTWGWNRDIYLAELTLPSQQVPFLVRLIDDYPNEFPSLPLGGLASKTVAMLRVLRDAQCDVNFRHMALRAAPGDPMAIMPVQLAYEPNFNIKPEPDAILPCYRTIRK